MHAVKAVDQFQRRHGSVGFPLAVGYKFVDDQGGYLAALITYYGFLSLFPALLLLVTAVGYFLAGNPSAQQKIIDTALAKFPVIGTQLQHNLSSIHGSSTAIIIGVLGLLYGALGIGQATQLAFNRAWAVPRNERPNALLSRVRSFGFVLLIGLGLVATTILTGIGAATGTLNSHHNDLVRLGLIAASILANVVLFIAVFRLLTARVVTVRELLPGAMFAALCWQLLQALGTTYVSRVVVHSSDIYGVFGIVLGLLAWIYLAAVILVLAAELNVVHACRLWPRSLLAPFADGLPLTPADERAYVSYVDMRRYKSFEHIDVTFDRTETPGTRGEE
jgi:YihY family inner membrane protein